MVTTQVFQKMRTSQVLRYVSDISVLEQQRKPFSKLLKLILKYTNNAWKPILISENYKNWKKKSTTIKWNWLSLVSYLIICLTFLWIQNCHLINNVTNFFNENLIFNFNSARIFPFNKRFHLLFKREINFHFHLRKKLANK